MNHLDSSFFMKVFTPLSVMLSSPAVLEAQPQAPHAGHPTIRPARPNCPIQPDPAHLGLRRHFFILIGTLNRPGHSNSLFFQQVHLGHAFQQLLHTLNRIPFDIQQMVNFFDQRHILWTIISAPAAHVLTDVPGKNVFPKKQAHAGVHPNHPPLRKLSESRFLRFYPLQSLIHSVGFPFGHIGWIGVKRL